LAPHTRARNLGPWPAAPLPLTKARRAGVPANPYRLIMVMSREIALGERL
jgi:hypothetical protein